MNNIFNFRNYSEKIISKGYDQYYFIITPNSANAGAATMSSSAIEMKTPPLASLTDVTNNSLSPVSYSEFLNGGAVAYIPAGIKNLELASFGQDPSLTLNFNELSELKSFSFVLSGNSFEALILQIFYQQEIM